MDLMRFLADHRTGVLDSVFSLATAVGEIEGYVLLVSLVFATWDKRLAFRLAVLTLITMSLNHVLKTVVMNPRPFVADGDWAERWAVSPERAAELVTEYSTPSGHAMSGSAFYTYLYASVKDRRIRIACLLLIVLTGLSRPYLGVHYLEDVLIGWVIGAGLALVAFRYASGIGAWWGRFSHPQQVAVAGAWGAAVFLVTLVLCGWRIADLPLAFVSHLGFLMGIVIAIPIEERTIDFDPRSASVAKKALRFVVGVALVLGTLRILDVAFDAVGDDYTAWGFVLRYVRYALAGIAGIYLGPLLFVKLGWAERRRPATSAGATVRPFRADEWRTFRDLRLRALADAPDAFARTLADEEGRSDREWAELLGASTSSPQQCSVVAELGGRAVGLAYGRIDDAQPEVAHLYAMWVDPAVRRAGVGLALVRAIAGWARSGGARNVLLDVSEGNAPAAALYARAGFVATSERSPLRAGSTLFVRTLRLAL
jgi:membrane-associated phospholipid phosphatase/ribosomal protein S18 acetylase RimI-like enzyme